MLNRFLQFIASKQLVPTGSMTLVATSGGVDSVVLCHLFSMAELPFAIAHCNFKLRGEASDLDEAFVNDLAARFKVDFHSIQFDTQDFAEQNKLSIQVAARELRYDWLEKTRQKTGYDQIATAHHLDDSIETVFYNYVKGCGLRGLHGISEQNGHVVRPMLFAAKQEVLSFAKSEHLEFREDASNASDKYNRNLIRHQVVPVFEKINPKFQQTAGENIQRLKDAEALLDFTIQKIKEAVFTEQADGWKIDHLKLRSYPAPSTVLFELTRTYGFNNDQVGQILQSIDNQPGSWFESPAGRLLVDRSFLIFSTVGNAGGVVNIDVMPDGAIQLQDGRSISLSRSEAIPESLKYSPFEAIFDAESLTFPLKLRHWQPGDWFCPLGMDGKRQKLQDFFSNNKLSRFDKEKVWILESGGNIAWVVGWRLDERFKVTGTTKKIIQAVFL